MCIRDRGDVDPPLHAALGRRMLGEIGQLLVVELPHAFLQLLLLGGVHAHAIKIPLARLLGEQPVSYTHLLGGAIFCLGCDLIARTVFAPMELSISSVTAVIGAPIVIGILLRKKVRG